MKEINKVKWNEVGKMIIPVLGYIGTFIVAFLAILGSEAWDISERVTLDPLVTFTFGVSMLSLIGVLFYCAFFLRKINGYHLVASLLLFLTILTLNPIFFLKLSIWIMMVGVISETLEIIFERSLEEYFLIKLINVFKKEKKKR